MLKSLLGDDRYGTGILILLVTVLVLTVPLVWQPYAMFRDFVDNKADQIIEKIPVVHFEDGQARYVGNIKEPVLYRIDEKTYIVVDTRDNYFQDFDELKRDYSSIPADASAPVFVTRDYGIIEKSAYETRRFDFREFKDVDPFTLDSGFYFGLLDKIDQYFLMVAYPLFAIFIFIGRLIYALCFSLVGMLFSKMAGAELGYKTILRLSILAMIPMMVVKTVFFYTGTVIPWSFLLYLLVSSVILFLFVSFVKQKRAYGMGYY
ncbi:MAG: DUF1189 family protein [Alphaproteobacteria bacterium]|nr:DUF1189 family protein [Alphaproteobacteria bacterium]